MEKITLRDFNGIDYLKTTDFENMFRIHVDERGNYVFNLNETTYFDADTDSMLTYKCVDSMFWPLISYKIYGTTRLAWLLMKINGVKPADIFKKLTAGATVRYVSDSALQVIVKTINGYNQ